jgi:hypothetical protein
MLGGTAREHARCAPDPKRYGLQSRGKPSIKYCGRASVSVACRRPHHAAIATGVTSVALAHFAAGDLPIALRLRIQLKCADV